MGTSRNPILTADAKYVALTASTCGVTSLLGATVFFFFWYWGSYETRQYLLWGIKTWVALSLLGGIIAGVTGITINMSNEKLRSGICGAIAGTFSMIAAEQILPTDLFTSGIGFPSFGPLSSQLFTLIIGAIAGVSAGWFSAINIGELGCFSSGFSAALGCVLASFIWEFAGSMPLHSIGDFFGSFLFSGLLAVTGAIIGGILGGLLGMFGNLIGFAANRTLSRLVGTTAGAAWGVIIAGLIWMIIGAI
jgi:hypothetical protein